MVAPCTAADAKGLLKSAIRDDDPVVFLEHKLLYAHKEEIPDGEYTIPLGAADVKRAGRDLTIITWSREVHFALEAAQTLEAEGIDVEVLDLRTLVPLDWDAIVKSVSKTHNVIIVSEEVKRGSYAGELSAQIAEELFDEAGRPGGTGLRPEHLLPLQPGAGGQELPPSGGYRAGCQARAEQVRRRVRWLMKY